MIEFYPTREVNTSFWENAREIGLSTEEKLVYLYALTNDSAPKPFYLPQIGEYVLFYKFSLKKASCDLGFSEERLTQILKRLTALSEKYVLLNFNEKTERIEIEPM